MTLDTLRHRLADFYGVEPTSVLPVRGALHGKELVMRLVAREGGKEIASEENWEVESLAEIYGLRVLSTGTDVRGAAFCHFDTLAPAALALLVVDESEIEFSERRTQAFADGRTIVIRSLEEAYRLKEAPCAALIAPPALIERLSRVLEPGAVPPVILKAALAGLDPPRLAAAKTHIERIKRERARMADALSSAPLIKSATQSERAEVHIYPADAAAALSILRAWKIDAALLDGGLVRIKVGAAEENDRTLLALGAIDCVSVRRTGEFTRGTAETRIVASVDLDCEGVIEIATGIGFFDHMLAQIAHHGGVSLTLSCVGDLDVDAHHTIEDCAIAVGQALSTALADGRGIARFGFVLPMDEAEAAISIDLGGRPYLVFDGAFKAAAIGAYPTEMTEHVFRSLSQSLGAAIHLSVKGDNDHHKTEACYKAFGRALRQALVVESEATPSTKGVI